MVINQAAQHTPVNIIDISRTYYTYQFLRPVDIYIGTAFKAVPYLCFKGGLRMKANDKVYIKATYAPNKEYKQGNMIRCVTAETGTVIYVTREELVKEGDR